MSSKKVRQEFNEQKKNYKKSSFKDIFRALTGAMFSQISKEGKYTQVNLREGVKRDGWKSIDAMLVELYQIDNMTPFAPLMVSEMSNKGRKMVLNMLVVIKEKRSW